MSDFLELLAADVADSSGASGMPGAPDSSDSAAPGITATNRVRTVLFECLFNHLADERVESLFTILGFEHDFDCYAIAGYPAGPPHVRPRKSRKSWPISAVCV